MDAIPLFAKLLLALGLSFFFGLAYEEFNSKNGVTRPGGIRTFPLLTLGSTALYLVRPEDGLLLSAGLIALASWLYAYYWKALSGGSNDPREIELIAPACNILAFALGPAAITQPPWFSIGVTVAAVLLLTAREQLHSLAKRIELAEIVTAGKFLALTGIVLPLLPDEQITDLSPITPFRAWLALLAVCTLSYFSYLIQRYVAARSDLPIAMLGGLYSSTATTVVIARRGSHSSAGLSARETGCIAIATSMMYLRVLAIVAIFNQVIALSLFPASFILSGTAGAIGWFYYSRQPPTPAPETRLTISHNPLELTSAAIFAILFVGVAIATGWTELHFGTAGTDFLAAIVGFADIDPFVLNLAESKLDPHTAASAILIATASNNLAKAAYTAGFAGWRRGLKAIAILIALSVASIMAAGLT